MIVVLRNILSESPAVPLFVKCTVLPKQQRFTDFFYCTTGSSPRDEVG